MAKVIIGGQMLSLVLALLVTPVFYALLDMFVNFTRRLGHPLLGRGAARPALSLIFIPSTRATASRSRHRKSRPDRTPDVCRRCHRRSAGSPQPGSAVSEAFCLEVGLVRLT